MPLHQLQATNGQCLRHLDIKDYSVNSDEFKSFFASVMLDLASKVAELLIGIVF